MTVLKYIVCEQREQLACLTSCVLLMNGNTYVKDVRDRNAIMVCEVKFGAKICLCTYLLI